MKKRINVLLHLLVSMLLLLVTLVVLDGYNPAMGFLNSGVSKVFYLLLCTVGLLVSVLQLWENR